MHDYRSLRYHDRREDIIETWEVDVDGLPTGIAMRTVINDSDPKYIRLARFYEALTPAPPFTCECGTAFNSWPEARDHLALYCDHRDHDEYGKCLSCGDQGVWLEEEAK